MTDPVADIHDPGPVPEPDDEEQGALAAMEAANYREALQDYRPNVEAE